MLALGWPDIDLERGVVRIGRGLVQGPDGLVEKDNQTRRVALDAPTTAALVGHRAAAVERATQCGEALADNAFVFAGDVARFDAVLPGLGLASVPEGVRRRRADGGAPA